MRGLRGPVGGAAFCVDHFPTETAKSTQEKAKVANVDLKPFNEGEPAASEKEDALPRAEGKGRPNSFGRDVLSFLAGNRDQFSRPLISAHCRRFPAYGEKGVKIDRGFPSGR